MHHELNLEFLRHAAFGAAEYGDAKIGNSLFF